jgi:hypothetical protein
MMGGEVGCLELVVGGVGSGFFFFFFFFFRGRCFHSRTCEKGMYIHYQLILSIVEKNFCSNETAW